MKWKSFKHRFVPWVAANWSTRLVRSVDSVSLLDKQANAVSQLKSQLELLSCIIQPMTPSEFKSQFSDSDHPEYQSLRLLAINGLFDAFGFTLSVQQSVVAEGLGVFVSHGRVKEGQLVALYPGTIYLPLQPLFFQSLNNPFILRCIDGIHIDGKHSRLSKLIYNSAAGEAILWRVIQHLEQNGERSYQKWSCAFRDINASFHLTCDLSWLSHNPLNPLSIGQLVNNQSRELAANVEYVEVDLSVGTVLNDYGHLLPNCYYGPLLDSMDVTRRAVALLATRDIAKGEEIYSSYFTVATS